MVTGKSPALHLHTQEQFINTPKTDAELMTLAGKSGEGIDKDMKPDVNWGEPIPADKLK